jgi:hypothetical protein
MMLLITPMDAFNLHREGYKTASGCPANPEPPRLVTALAAAVSLALRLDASAISCIRQHPVEQGQKSTRTKSMVTGGESYRQSARKIRNMALYMIDDLQGWHPCNGCRTLSFPYRHRCNLLLGDLVTSRICQVLVAPDLPYDAAYVARQPRSAPSGDVVGVRPSGGTPRRWC